MAYVASEKRDGRPFTQVMLRSRAWNNERSVEILEKHLSLNKLVPPPSLLPHLRECVNAVQLEK